MNRELTVLRTLCGSIVVGQLLLCTLDAAELRCRVTNGTTGQPVSPETAVLMTLGQGMDEVGSRENPGAAFDFTDLAPAEQYLLQVTYKDVRYNTQFTFDRSNLLEKAITVYDVGTDESKITVSLPHLVLGIDASTITADLTFDVNNAGRTVSSEGLKFALPAGFDRVESATATTSQMPTPQEVARLGQTGHYAVKYPIKPGHTQISLVFKAPYTGRFEYRQEFFYPVEGYHVFVIPPSIAVESEGLESRGESQSGFAEYAGGPLAKGGALEMSLAGEAASAGSMAADQAPHGEDQVIEHPPALFRYRTELILLMVIVISLGFWFGLRELPDQETKKR
ncbi:MAG: hypothetical protein HYX75_09310 [Acidobacteria bacterium]|nr:hypothetical protein [Acidobacteriota bacterium]